jgi:hypothetical protein
MVRQATNADPNHCHHVMESVSATTSLALSNVPRVEIMFECVDEYWTADGDGGEETKAARSRRAGGVTAVKIRQSTAPSPDRRDAFFLLNRVRAADHPEQRAYTGQQPLPTPDHSGFRKARVEDFPYS